MFAFSQAVVFTFACVAIFGVAFAVVYVSDDLVNGHHVFSVIGLFLHANLVFLVLGISGTLRRNFNRMFAYGPIDTAEYFRYIIIWSTVGFAIIHTAFAWRGIVERKPMEQLGWHGLFRMGFASGVGWSGHLLLLILLVLAVVPLFGLQLPRFARIDVRGLDTWLWIVFFITWALHESFMVPNADAEATTKDHSSVLLSAWWPYWIVGACSYLAGRLMTALDSPFKVSSLGRKEV